MPQSRASRQIPYTPPLIISCRIFEIRPITPSSDERDCAALQNQSCICTFSQWREIWSETSGAVWLFLTLSRPRLTTCCTLAYNLIHLSKVPSCRNETLVSSRERLRPFSPPRLNITTPYPDSLFASSTSPIPIESLSYPHLAFEIRNNSSHRTRRCLDRRGFCRFFRDIPNFAENLYSPMSLCMTYAANGPGS